MIFDLTSIADLKPAPYNPRRIDAESLAALGVSMHEFGDISGIIFNSRSGNLVAGHMRLRALKEQHGDALRLEDGAVVAPDGARYPVRVVDWDAAREKAANVAANSMLLAGEFTEDLGPLLDEINLELPDLSEALRLPELIIPIDLTVPDANQAIDEEALAETSHECPQCGFKW